MLATVQLLSKFFDSFDAYHSQVTCESMDVTRLQLRSMYNIRVISISCTACCGNDDGYSLSNKYAFYNI